MDLCGGIDEKFKVQLVDWKLVSSPIKFEGLRIRKLSTCSFVGPMIVTFWEESYARHF